MVKAKENVYQFKNSKSKWGPSSYKHRFGKNKQKLIKEKEEDKRRKEMERVVKEVVEDEEVME